MELQTPPPSQEPEAHKAHTNQKPTLDLAYRPLQESSDWVQVQELLKRIPISPKFPLAAQRLQPYSTAFPKIKGHSVDMVATHEEQVVAFMHSMVSPRWLQDREIPIVYGGDGRVDSQYRRYKIGSKVFAQALQHYQKNNFTVGFVMVLENNLPMRRFLQNLPIATYKMTTYQATSLFVIGRRHKSSRHSVFEEFRPQPIDFEPLLETWHQTTLAPQVSREDLVRFFNDFPEIRVFRRKDSKRWAFALWDQSTLRRLSFTQTNRLTRTVKPIWNLFSRLGMAGKFPDVGQAWRSLEVCFTTSESQHAELKPFLIQIARQGDYHTVNLLESGLNSTEWRSSHWAEHKMHIGLYLFSPTERFPEWLKLPIAKPIHLDLGFV